MSKVIERGDIYFFYRNKIKVDTADSLDDIQNFYMILAPDGVDKKRLFIIGKKRLPEILPGKSSPTEREWMMVSTVSRSAGIEKALKPVHYQTKTRGRRRQSQAIPVGAGRYALKLNDNDSRLLYSLKQPEKRGKAQRELGIEKQASYIISVRNPAIDVAGFPDASPRYPKILKQRFAKERWLAVEEARLLDYKNAQLLLIGAHKNLGSDADQCKGQPELFKRLNMQEPKWPTEALLKGRFARPDGQLESRPSSGNRSKGGQRGGAKAAGSASASGVATALKGVNFPCNRSGLVKHAKQHDAKMAVVELLSEFPARRFRSMADVRTALSEVR